VGVGLAGGAGRVLRADRVDEARMVDMLLRAEL
jgi:hypothetical protein